MVQQAAVLPARPTITKQVWRPKKVVPWFESKFMANKAIIALRRKIRAMHCWSSSLANFDLCECFLARKLYQKTGGAYVRTKNWHVLSDRSDLWVPPVRPVWSKTTKYNLDFTIG
jgi:hypothetical protein